MTTKTTWKTLVDPFKHVPWEEPIPFLHATLAKLDGEVSHLDQSDRFVYVPRVQLVRQLSWHPMNHSRQIAVKACRVGDVDANTEEAVELT